MSDDVDPIIVAGDDGMILEESTEREDDRATLDEFGVVATDGGEPVDDIQDESDDTITVTDDDDEVLCEIDVPAGAEVSHSEDGSITTIKRPTESGGGLGVHVDPGSELGERLSWIAGHRGMSTDELLVEALRDELDLDRELWTDERLGVGDRTAACEHCGERFDVTETRGTFDGDVARYVCPECGHETEGPPSSERGP